jgi:predicted small lipoprotein YifL
MSKRIISLLLALTMILSLAGCRSAEPAPAPAPAETPAEAPAEAPVAEDYKIGIITGTVSQGEEEYQAAQNWSRNMAIRS